MASHKLIPIFLACLALAWMIIKSTAPDGGTIPWFIGLLLFALVSYYYGFVEKSFNPFRFYAKAGFVTFITLSVLMAYIARLEDDGLEEIAGYIEVYPIIEEIHFIPRVSDKTIQHWQIKTTSTAEAVKQFYNDQKNLRDWQVVVEEPVLVFEKANLKLTIAVAEQPRSSLSNIFYHLEHKTQ